VQFIQEPVFTFELEQIVSDGCKVDDLTRCVEESCRRNIRSIEAGQGCARATWNGAALRFWYCVNGGIVTLLSIAAAD